MNSNRNKYLLVGVAIIIVIAGYYLLKDTFTEWDYNLDKSKKNAYGTFLTYELLKEKYKKEGFTEIDKSVIESFRKLKKNKTYNYVFINEQPNYDSATLDTICKFANAGNTVFISCESLYGQFSDSILFDNYHLKLTTAYNNLYYKYTDSFFTENKVSTFNFSHPTLQDKKGYDYYVMNRADTLNTYFLNFEAIPDSEIIHPIIETNSISFGAYEKTYDVGLNFAILKHGKGQFVILLTALPFTNYFMRSEKGLEYAEKIFAHLPNQATIWDNVSHEYNFKNNKNKNHGDSSYGDSPLYFIIQNRQLRWAWYLTILGILIYALFHAKRRQNIIPIIEPKENNSLKYVETIGQLYFHEEEHLEIANEMRLQFMNFIRQKYYLKTNEIDETFLQQLALNSAIEIEKIQLIFNEFKDILKIKSINQKKLQYLNNLLENFYKNCK